MRHVVTGLMMLAGAVVRDQGQGIDDLAWRRGAEAAASETRAGDTTVMVVAGPPMGTANGDSIDRELATIDDEGMESVAPGDWDVACLRKRGSKLVIDRESVRELGSGTLFRWAAPSGELPETSEPIYTAVADCHAKSIEASWPGKRTPTRAGTCGRFLVEAACAAVSH
jgi:hypothetical protein